LPAARDPRSRQPRRGNRRLARSHAGRGSGLHVLRGIPRDEPPPVALGRGGVARGDARRVRPSDSWVAGASRRQILWNRVRRRAGVVRRVPRRGAGHGAVPMSAYPLTLEGTSISALVVGAGRVATRKAL